MASSVGCTPGVLLVCWYHSVSWGSDLGRMLSTTYLSRVAEEYRLPSQLCLATLPCDISTIPEMMRVVQ